MGYYGVFKAEIFPVRNKVRKTYFVEFVVINRYFITCENPFQKWVVLENLD